MPCFLRPIAIVNQAAAYLASWLIGLMMFLTVSIVALRYGFNIGSIALQELSNYCHASAFLLASAFTLRAEEHVRVDIFYASMTQRQQAWVNTFGTLFLLFPFVLFCLYAGGHFFVAAWQIKESSSEPGGLPFVYLLKGLIPLSMLLLLLEALSFFVQQACRLVYQDACADKASAR